VLASACAYGGDAAPATPDPVAIAVKKAREFFKERKFIEALDQFALALTLKPEDRDTAFMAGVAAYWSRQPARAMEFWNELLDTAPRNSREEWKLETHRIMALYQLNQHDAAEAVAERIYDLHKRFMVQRASGTAGADDSVFSDGFVREHIFLTERVTEQDRNGAGVKDMQRVLRVGCWEVFDDRKEAQNIFAFPVTVHSAKDDPLIKRLVVAVSVLPGGEAGYVLTEEGGEDRTVYKRWLQRPPYAEVRTLVLQALKGKAVPLAQTKKAPAPAAAESKTPVASGKVSAPQSEAPSDVRQAEAPPAAPQPEAPKERLFTQAELGSAAKVMALGLETQAAQILTLAGRLREVDLDITKLTRLSLSDPQLAERYLEEMKAKSPYAQEDAAELVDFIAKAKSEHLAAAMEKLPKIGARTPYLDYVLLTALNTRGKDMYASLLKECQSSGDFMVRHTASLMLSRSGDKKAIGHLVRELTAADELASNIVQDSLVELVGNDIAEPPPGSGPALKKWKSDVAQWWNQNERKLAFNEQRRESDPYWKTQK